jgi:hypothetical protein
MLAPGAAVGHANPELDWEGVIEADHRDRWAGTDEVRVRWTAGIDGNDVPLAGSEPGWVAATAVRITSCPASSPARRTEAPCSARCSISPPGLFPCPGGTWAS